LELFDFLGSKILTFSQIRTLTNSNFERKTQILTNFDHKNQTLDKCWLWEPNFDLWITISTNFDLWITFLTNFDPYTKILTFKNPKFRPQYQNWTNFLRRKANLWQILTLKTKMLTNFHSKIKILTFKTKILTLIQKLWPSNQIFDKCWPKNPNFRPKYQNLTIFHLKIRILTFKNRNFDLNTRIGDLTIKISSHFGYQIRILTYFDLKSLKFWLQSSKNKKIVPLIRYNNM